MNTSTEFWAAAVYGTYAFVASCVTIWVGRTLRIHVPQFFASGNEGKDQLTESMSRLVLTGFYLVNFGAISLALKSDTRILDRVDAFELLSTKIGMVMLVQGVVHFMILAKLFGFSRGTQSPESLSPNFEARMGR